MEFIKELGQFPILQFFGGLLVLAVGAYAIVRGFNDKRKADQTNPPEQRWFFDGPLNVALQYLREISKGTDQVARELRTLNETAKENQRILDDIKHNLENMPSRRRRVD